MDTQDNSSRRRKKGGGGKEEEEEQELPPFQQQRTALFVCFVFVLFRLQLDDDVSLCSSTADTLFAVKSKNPSVPGNPDACEVHTAG